MGHVPTYANGRFKAFLNSDPSRRHHQFFKSIRLGYYMRGASRSLTAE